ncbi:MAG TPA: hypothetical protein VEF04_11285 [Blastocatellia bacterium]|nr:hypothetical protein [Blastocatellia bacterium]
MSPISTYQIVVPIIVVFTALAFCLIRPMPYLRIVMMCIVVVSIYGILQDQISVRISPDYFAVTHPPINGVSSLALLGLIWGFLGSWWGGLIIGLMLATAAIFGRRPKVNSSDLLIPIIIWTIATGTVTAIAGLSGYVNGLITGISLGDPWAAKIPRDRHLQFFAIGCAHLGTYVGGLLGAVGLCIWTLRKRYEHLLADPAQEAEIERRLSKFSTDDPQRSWEDVKSRLKAK